MALVISLPRLRYQARLTKFTLDTGNPTTFPQSNLASSSPAKASLTDLCAQSQHHPPARVSEQFPEDGAVAARLVLAVAAHGEVGPVGQRGQQRDGVPGGGRRHLGAVAPGVGGPLRRRGGAAARLHGGGPGRQQREPDVVPVPGGVLGPGHAPGRVADGADAGPLAGQPRRAQPHDADAHGGPAVPRFSPPARSPSRGGGAAAPPAPPPCAGTPPTGRAATPGR
jgi:hypothetical protein